MSARILDEILDGFTARHASSEPAGVLHLVVHHVGSLRVFLRSRTTGLSSNRGQHARVTKRDDVDDARKLVSSDTNAQISTVIDRIRPVG